MRAARIAQGLSLAQLGARAGYSASQLSRYERGITPLTDIDVLRRFASVLGLPSEAFGLSPLARPGTTRHAEFTQHRPRAARGNNVDHERQREDGDDDVRRRELLAGLTGLSAAAVVAAPARAGTSRVGDPAALTGPRESVQGALNAEGPAGGQVTTERLAAAVRYYDLNFSRFPPALIAAEVRRTRLLARQILRHNRDGSTQRELRRSAGWLAALDGNLAYILADHTSALIHLGTSARLGTATGDDDLVCWSLGALTMTANAQGRHAEALELATSAYDYASTPLRRAQILAWGELRSLAARGGQHRADARRVMALAQDQMAADQHGERPGRFGFDLAELHLHIAEATLALGDPTQARKHALESIACTTTGRPGWAAATLVLARGEAARGRHSDAASLARHVLDVIPPSALRDTSRARLRDLDKDLCSVTSPSTPARELRERLRALPPLSPSP